MKTSQHKERAIIWLQTFLLICGYAVAIWASNRYFLGQVGYDWLALALGFCAVQCLVVIGLMTWLMVRKQWFLWLKARSQQLFPQIQEQLALVALGAEHQVSASAEAEPPSTRGVPTEDGPRHRGTMMEVRAMRDRMELSHVSATDFHELKSLRKRYPIEFESCFVRFLPSVTGVGNHRLSVVAEHIGLVDKWRRLYHSRNVEKRRQAIQKLSQLSSVAASKVLVTALGDRDVMIRIEAARGLVYGGGQSERERLFSFLLAQPLIVRSMLIVDLQPYAHELSKRAIPQALASQDGDAVLVSLQIIEAWGRVVPVNGYANLVSHENARVRAQAFRTLPFVEDREIAVVGYDRWITDGLRDNDSQVQRAAAQCAGRLVSPDLVPDLEKVLLRGDTLVSLAAAFALAENGTAGPAVLEKAILEATPSVAAIALEALEKLDTGRLEFHRS